MTAPVTIPAEMHEAMATIERIGGRELVTKIAGMFETSARERLARLPDLAATGDHRQVSRVAHAMKGSAAQVGATMLRDLAAGLEKEAGTLEPAALQARLVTLSEVSEQAFQQLAAVTAAGGAP